MFWKSLLLVVAACLLIQFGALMAWVSVLAAVLHWVLLAVLAVALYFGINFLWRRFKQRNSHS